MGFHLRHIAALAAIGLFAFLAGCGGGGGGGSSLPTGPNVQAVSVEAFGNAPNVNLLYVTVRVCVPGNAVDCQSIDHVLVDTGSYGLRIMSSVLAPVVATGIVQSQITGVPLGECGQFASGHTWGAVKLADVHVAQETASSIPIQVIGDSAFPTVPSSCSSSGAPIETVQDLGANGILGIGNFIEDCGAPCVTGTANHFYFTCPAPGNTCTDSTVPLAQQVVNPVSRFAVNNNGTMIVMPSIPNGGTSSVTGALVFGVGTQGNNGLGNAHIQSVDPSDGTFTTTISGAIAGTYTTSFLDSGSNGLFFDAAITLCPGGTGFYCPASTLSLTASNQTTSGGPIVFGFQIANAQTLLQNNPTGFAQPQLAGSANLSGVFDWGLPFFFGRNVYTVIEGNTLPAGPGPFFAY